MQTFEYGQIPIAENEVRLVTLLPGRKTDQIKCELSTRTLEAITDNSTYEALSYCWGTLDANMRVDIYIGLLRMGTILVKPNLHAALLVFRREIEVRKLWIDAICIDQMSDKEKNLQVPLMRRIYEGSSSVLVWLGEGTKHSDPSTSLIKKLNKAASDVGSHVPNINVLSSQDHKNYGLPSPYTLKGVVEYNALLSLLETEWFYRAWIVQEVTVAKKATLFWGPFSTEMNELISGMDFAFKAHLAFTVHPVASSFLPLATEAAAYRSRKSTLLSVLLRHRRSRASIPADKLYAFLGLTGNFTARQATIHVDFGQDVRTIYTDVARRIATNDKSLDILSLPPLPPGSGIEGLPSWVPDWSIPSEDSARQLRYTMCSATNSLANGEEAEYRKSKPFCAATTTLYTGNLDQTRHSILTTRGHTIDKVAAVGDLLEGFYIARNLRSLILTVRSFLRMRHTLSNWEGVAELKTKHGNDKYVNGEEIVDAFWETLATGNFSDEHEKWELRQVYEGCERNWKFRLLGLSLLMTFLIVTFPPVRTLLFKEKRADILQYLMFRRMIRTKQKGYLGLVSGDVRTGDEIWLLEGSKVPLIIRRQKEGYGRLVGDAYIHGVMYGEAFKIEDCEDLMLE